MCGRVLRTSPVELLTQLFDLLAAPNDLRDRYNLAPTDPIPVIRTPRHLELLRWGLEMPSIRMAGINARVESLSKPIYREKVREKRCLVVVDGFYEWRALGGKKQPYLIAREDRAPLVMAGIYDSSGRCAIITAPAAGVVASLHTRMPVLLEREAFDTWLDPAVKDVREVLAKASGDGLTCYPVSTRVNAVRNDDAMLVTRVPEPVAEVKETAKGKTLSLF